MCNGGISLPDLPRVAVANLTLQEAQNRLQQSYQSELPNANIFINFKKYRERQVFIIGAKYSPISLRGTTRLSEVLAQAVLPLYANLCKSYVVRNEQRLPIDLYKLIHEGDQTQNTVMRGGDCIYIAKASEAVVMVTGEVPAPILIPLIHGVLPLREAIVAAGGIPFTGDKTCIQIIRGNRIAPKIYCLNWYDILHTPNSSLLLKSGDIVVISATPITDWNRFIGQLQPSTTGMQTTYNLYRLLNTK